VLQALDSCVVISGRMNELSDQVERYEVIIVGAGPAGLTGAIYCSWLGFRTLVLEASHSGGRAASAAVIENFPGFEDGVAGPELVGRMHMQAKRLGAAFRTLEEVVGLDLKGGTKMVKTRKASYFGRAVIMATGTQRRKLLVPGESDFLGRGVSYCSICDGPFFRNRNVAVVGASKEAFSDAAFLVGIARHVILVAQHQEDIAKHNLEKLRGKPNFEFVQGQVVSITGDKLVRSVRIYDEKLGREVEREVTGVFVSLGGVPMTEVVKSAGVVVDSRGCIVVDRMQRTNLEGVFAAGDCTCGGMQVVTAAGEGAMAAMKACATLTRTKE
jgi:thioredoxin reductase (NADPH)